MISVGLVRAVVNLVGDLPDSRGEGLAQCDVVGDGVDEVPDRAVLRVVDPHAPDCDQSDREAEPD